MTMAESTTTCCSSGASQGNGNDRGRQNEVDAERGLDLALLENHQIGRRVCHGVAQLLVLGLILGLAVEESVGELFKPSKHR
jgi:hypothetical protein